MLLMMEWMWFSFFRFDCSMFLNFFVLCLCVSVIWVFLIRLVSGVCNLWVIFVLKVLSWVQVCLMCFSVLLKVLVNIDNFFGKVFIGMWVDSLCGEKFCVCVDMWCSGVSLV